MLDGVSNQTKDRRTRPLQALLRETLNTPVGQVPTDDPPSHTNQSLSGPAKAAAAQQPERKGLKMGIFTKNHKRHPLLQFLQP